MLLPFSEAGNKIAGYSRDKELLLGRTRALCHGVTLLLIIVPGDPNQPRYSCYYWRSMGLDYIAERVISN